MQEHTTIASRVPTTLADLVYARAAEEKTSVSALVRNLVCREFGVAAPTVSARGSWPHGRKVTNGADA
jgi:hypothetical protein